MAIAIVEITNGILSECNGTLKTVSNLRIMESFTLMVRFRYCLQLLTMGYR